MIKLSMQLTVVCPTGNQNEVQRSGTSLSQAGKIDLHAQHPKFLGSM